MAAYNCILLGFVLCVLIHGLQSVEIKMVEDRFIRLEERLQRQENTIRSQEHTIRDQNRRIERLETMIMRTNAENWELTQKNQGLIKRFTLYEAELETIKQTLVYTKSEENRNGKYYVPNIDNPPSKNRQKNELIDDKDVGRSLSVNKSSIRQEAVKLEKERRLLLPGSTTQIKETVAFYAYMSTKETNPSKHHTLIYDTERVDIGGGYNSYTGIYTVPVDGIYVFCYSVRVYCRAFVGVEIVKNGIPEGYIVADAEEDCDNDMTSGTAVIPAVKGDTVFVRTHEIVTAQGSIYNGAYGRASFSGWLLG